MADEEELEELRELKNEEEGGELEEGEASEEGEALEGEGEEFEEDASGLTQRSPNKIIIGLLSFVVFIALFIFFRGEKKNGNQESEGPTINVPSLEETLSPPPLFPKDEAFQDTIVEEPSGGEILIQSDGDDVLSDGISIVSEDPESMDSENERIDPIPEREISIFATLKENAPKDLSKPPPSEPEETVEPKETVLARKPDIKPDISPEGRFAIQVGAFKKEGGAKVLAQRLERKGYDSFVSNADGKLFRVQVGPFENRKAAKKIATQIRKSERLDSFIVRR